MSFSVISKGISNLKIKNKSNLRGKALCLSLGQVLIMLSRDTKGQQLFLEGGGEGRANIYICWKGGKATSALENIHKYCELNI